MSNAIATVSRLETQPVHHSALPERARRKAGQGLGSVGVLDDHAQVMALEAADRYREFAVIAADRGDDEIADLFSELHELESDEADRLPPTSVGMAPAHERGQHAWLCQEPASAVTRAFLASVLTPRQLLEIALAAEERAKAFFERAALAANDGGDRELAAMLGRDRESHIALLRDALRRMPARFLPGELCPGDPAALQGV